MFSLTFSRFTTTARPSKCTSTSKTTPTKTSRTSSSPVSTILPDGGGRLRSISMFVACQMKCFSVSPQWIRSPQWCCTPMTPTSKLWPLRNKGVWFLLICWITELTFHCSLIHRMQTVCIRLPLADDSTFLSLVRFPCYWFENPRS